MKKIKLPKLYREELGTTWHAWLAMRLAIDRHLNSEVMTYPEPPDHIDLLRKLYKEGVFTPNGKIRNCGIETSVQIATYLGLKTNLKSKSKPYKRCRHCGQLIKNLWKQ